MKTNDMKDYTNAFTLIEYNGGIDYIFVQASERKS